MPGTSLSSPYRKDSEAQVPRPPWLSLSQCKTPSPRSGTWSSWSKYRPRNITAGVSPAFRPLLRFYYGSLGTPWGKACTPLSSPSPEATPTLGQACLRTPWLGRTSSGRSSADGRCADGTTTATSAARETPHPSKGVTAGGACHLRSKYNVLLFEVLQLLLKGVQVEVVLDGGG